MVQLCNVQNIFYIKIFFFFCSSFELFKKFVKDKKNLDRDGFFLFNFS